MFETLILYRWINTRWRP